MLMRAPLFVLLLFGAVACRDDATSKGTSGASGSASGSATGWAGKPAASTATPLTTSSGPEPKPPAAPELEEAKGEDEVSFTFAPAVDGPITVETVRVKQKGRTGASFGREVMRTEKRVTVTKKGDDYEWHVKPVSFSVHGKRSTRVDELVETFDITYRLDEEGKVQEVTGYDDVASRAKTFLRDKTLKSLGPSLTSEALRRTRKQEWQSRVDDLSGETVKLGEPIITSGEITLPKGSAKTYRVTRYGPWLDCPPPLGRCLRIESHQHTHVDQLAELTGLSAETIRAATEESPDEEGAPKHPGSHQPPKPSGSSEPAGSDPHAGHDHQGGPPPGAPPIGYAEHSVRIVDPTTSLPLWERIERNIDLGIAQLADTATTRYGYGKTPSL